MSASITITLQVSVSTQKNDRVAVTGSCKALGEWNPKKIRFMRPKTSIHDKDVWVTKIDIPLTSGGVDYRYLVCRKFSYADGDDAGDETYIIRHWESGVNCRYKTIFDLGSNSSVDTYGVFEPGSKMYVDQGWLINETEIQLRLYRHPIQMYKKRHKADSYNVKCSAVNLYHSETIFHDSSSSFDGREENFGQYVHGSNPLIRVSSLGKYKNKEQSSHGMAVSGTDYVIYKLRTYEWDSHGVKLDFYKATEDPNEKPTLLGYTNLLPFHLECGSGSVSLAINDSQGFPMGHVAVRYLVCKPVQTQSYDLSESFALHWKWERPTLSIGHRGLGNTHTFDINSVEQKEEDLRHENTLGSLMKAGDSGADYVEFDVMLSKDKIPIIWHDFKVSILLRKKTKGRHQGHPIPVHELTLSQLQDLRVDFVKTTRYEYLDTPDAAEVVPSAHMSPFPTLKEALDSVDDCVGFYVELKYPQHLYQDKLREDGLESYYERNIYLDPILEVLHQHARCRRIVLASFDPDICIMARLKQNRFPVIMLIEDLGSKSPYYHDIRTQTVHMAVSLAASEKFLGLSVNAEALLRENKKLLEHILSENLVCFAWGANANIQNVREELKQKKVHAICYDGIGKNDACTMSIFRAEHEDEKLRLCVTRFQGVSPNLSPTPSVSEFNSNQDLASLDELQAGGTTRNGSTDSGSPPHYSRPVTGISATVSGGGIPIIQRPVPVTVSGSTSSCSSLDKMVEANLSDTNIIGHRQTHNGLPNDTSYYTTDFY